jgi:hypothetical protein
MAVVVGGGRGGWRSWWVAVVVGDGRRRDGLGLFFSFGARCVGGGIARLLERIPFVL